MATETGKVTIVTSQAEGTIQRDPPNASPNPVQYNDPTLIDRKIFLNMGDSVVYDIDLDAVITNINLNSAPPVDPEYPYNSQFPGATIIDTPQTKDLTVDGNTVIIDGVILTGNVKVRNGGTLVIKSPSPTSSIQATITGHIHASESTTVIIFNSIINGNIAAAGSTTLSIIRGTTVKGNTEIARTQNLIIKGTTVKGNAELQKNQNIIIKGTTVKGNAEIHENMVSTIITDLTSTDGNVSIQGNVGCSYKNITAPKGKVNISGCTVA
jgi:hypothetical protein